MLICTPMPNINHTKASTEAQPPRKPMQAPTQICSIYNISETSSINFLSPKQSEFKVALMLRIAMSHSSSSSFVESAGNWNCIIGTISRTEPCKIWIEEHRSWLSEELDGSRHAIHRLFRCEALSCRRRAHTPGLPDAVVKEAVQEPRRRWTTPSPAHRPPQNWWQP